jgi:hypothetical protein
MVNAKQGENKKRSRISAINNPFFVAHITHKHTDRLSGMINGS